MGEVSISGPDIQRPTASLARGIYRDASFSSPISRFAQGAKVAWESQRLGVRPRALQEALFADQQVMTDFQREINDAHAEHNIPPISVDNLERGVRMVFAGWAERMMVLSPTELETVMSTTASFHGNREKEQAYVDFVNQQLETRLKTERARRGGLFHRRRAA